MRTAWELLSRLQELRREVGFNTCGDQKPVRRWVHAAASQQDVICSVAGFSGAGDLFQDRTDFIAGPIPEPILDAIEDDTRFFRNLRVLFHDLFEDLQNAFPEFFPFPLTLPACPLAGDLFLGFG